MMKKKNEGAFGFAGTAFLLIVCAVIMVTLCTSAYGKISESRDFSDSSRGTLSYIQTQVKSHDSEGCVAVREGMLVLSESDGENEYELRIYSVGGKLLEEYSPAGSPKNPENAVEIAETESFSAEFIKDDLLKITTDYGECLIHLFAEGNKGAVK